MCQSAEVADRRLVEFVHRVRIHLAGPEEDGDRDGYGGEHAENSKRRGPAKCVGRGLQPGLALDWHAGLGRGAFQQRIRHVTPRGQGVRCRGVASLRPLDNKCSGPSCQRAMAQRRSERRLR